MKLLGLFEIQVSKFLQAENECVDPTLQLLTAQLPDTDVLATPGEAGIRLSKLVADIL